MTLFRDVLAVGADRTSCADGSQRLEGCDDALTIGPLSYGRGLSVFRNMG